MSETPSNKPLMTITPDGYVPRKMQLQKVTGAKISLVQPETEEEPETPTKASNGFIRKSIAASGIFIGMGSSLYNGANMGAAIANENSALAFTSAIGLGLGAVGVGINTFLFLKK